MELIFNELSVHPLAQDKTESYNRVSELIKTYKKATEKGFKMIRFEKQYNEIELSPQYTLHDYCIESKNRNYKSLLLGLRRYPYIDSNSDQEVTYIENTYYIDKNSNRVICYGLAAAYLYSTSGIGFLSESFWDQVQFKIVIENSNYEEGYAFCISHENHIANTDFQLWLDGLGDIELIQTNIEIKDKEINLRDDHGKDILKAFAKRIRKSSYVTKIINSLPFNPQKINFIKKVHPDGKIEIVLTDTDPGYGMIIQTTGRNKRETEEIAKILKQEYYN